MVFDMFVKEGETIVNPGDLYYSLIYEIVRCKDAFEGVDAFCHDLSGQSASLGARLRAFLEGPTHKLIVHLLPKIEEALEKEPHQSVEDIMRLIRMHCESLNSTYSPNWIGVAQYVETPKERNFLESQVRRFLLNYRKTMH
jgi:hypothetical protein